jgi:hypothetical protein
MCVMIFLVWASRWDDKYNGLKHYMNVNAGHEFWRDIKKPLFLHQFNNSSAVIYLTWMITFCNFGLNGMCVPCIV